MISLNTEELITAIRPIYNIIKKAREVQRPVAPSTLRLYIKLASEFNNRKLQVHNTTYKKYVTLYCSLRGEQSKQKTL